MNILARWSAWVRKDGQAPAITEASSGKTATRSQVHEGALAWAARHAPQGLHRHTVVFALPNGIAWMETFLGILQAGGIALPLDSAEPPASQRSTAERLGARYHLTHGNLHDAVHGKKFRLAGGCLIKLTSGSTGLPKALLFTEAQMAADADAIVRTMGFKASDTHVGLIPFGHSYGLGNLTFPLLCSGQPILCGSSPLPHAIAADFETYRPTVFPGVPTLFRGLVQSEVAALPGLRLAISAGAPLSPEIAQAFRARFKVSIHGFYGSSETGGIAYDRTGTSTLEGSGVGRALEGVHVRALPDQKIEIRGPAVLTHGNRRRHAGLGAWVAADRVDLAKDGSLQLLGRKDQTVKVGGRRVSLQEVLALVKSVPGVTEAWIGISDQPEPVLGAALSGTIEPSAVRKALEGRAPSWKIPKRWAKFDAFPVSARGKTDHLALKRSVFPPSQKS